MSGHEVVWCHLSALSTPGAMMYWQGVRLVIWRVCVWLLAITLSWLTPGKLFVSTLLSPTSVFSPVRVPGCNAPLIHLLISALYIYIVCLFTWLPHLLPFYSARNARIASAVLATAIPSVRLSVVCPTHAGIVSKRRHVARCSLHRWIAKCV